MADDDLFNVDLGAKDLGELEGLRGLYERNADQARDANRADKGFGSGVGSIMDDKSNESRQKQTALSMEINDRLFDIHESRSKTARIADENKDAEIADSPQQWASNPNEYDWPGIDTKR